MDRWQRISHIFQTALAQDAHERDAFLSAVCEGDSEIRRQVESLLEAAEERTRARRGWPSGARFAQYLIVDPLGAGGMGEVYRARDEQLDRDVAVKVLPASTFDDPTARARLVREARAAAALNHPNVCTVYQVGEANGQTYIAMELVEGETLSATLAGGPLPSLHVVLYGRQLADALVHAHDRGVIHRDLKSHNVIVTPDSRIKVLDFGLAKRSSEADYAAATHLHISLTQPGTAVGTLAYMSPEQLRGESATVRSDIWALGVVLYEMAAGTLPFAGQTPFELSAAILNEPAKPLPPHVPSALRAVVERCLAKDSDRYANARDVRAALEGIRVDDVDTPPRPSSPIVPMGTAGTATRASLDRRSAVARAIPRRAVVAAIAAGIAAGIAVGAWRLWPAGGTVRRLAVLPFQNPTKDEDLEYLCEGIADSLIKQTSKLRSLRVANLATVLNFKGPSVDASSTGKQLGVETILAGTLERNGSRLVISARLVDVLSGREVWRKNYDRESSELLGVQDEIASAIMDDGLRLELDSDERSQLVRHPTTDGDAYDLYLQARYLQRRATEEDYLYSRQLLERAVIRDPKFALAYAALSGNYAMMVTDGLERPTDAWPQVRRYMRQALEIDPDLPEAHAFEHALAFLFDWDWKAAAQARQRLLRFPVGDFDPHVLRALAIEHWALGRPEEALKLARRTREMDPMSPYLAVLEADYLLRTGQLDAAVPLYERAIRLEPDSPNSYFGLAEARFRQGHYDEAIEARRKAHELAGDTGLKAVLDTAKGQPGYLEIDRAWVRLQLDALKTRAATSYVSPLDLARAYAQLGEKEPTFKYLEAAFVDRSPGLVFLKVDRAWDAVRDDPRFAAAVRRVGLP
jgi:eukaryotic-like serine/threonine-protein kinase